MGAILRFVLGSKIPPSPPFYFFENRREGVFILLLLCLFSVRLGKGLRIGPIRVRSPQVQETSYVKLRLNFYSIVRKRGQDRVPQGEGPTQGDPQGLKRGLDRTP